MNLCRVTPPPSYEADSSDNCPDVANADQSDSDDDGEGDACDEAPTQTPDVPTPTPTEATPTPDEATPTPDSGTPTPGDQTPTPADMSPEPTDPPSAAGGCSCNTTSAEPLPLTGAGLMLLGLTALMRLRRRER